MENEETIWIKICNRKHSIKIGLTYMPQESRTHIKDLQLIYDKIKSDVVEAYFNNDKIVLLWDFNYKVGKVIKGNTSECTKGGKLLNQLMRQTDLMLINSLSKSKGLWTRIQNQEKSIIDYALIKKEDAISLRSVIIDEIQQFAPCKFVTNNNAGEEKYSGHRSSLL